jgi:hypothetical protein
MRVYATLTAAPKRVVSKIKLWLQIFNSGSHNCQVLAWESWFLYTTSAYNWKVAYTPWIRFHFIIYFSLTWQWPGWPPVISSLLVPTCKVRKGDSSHHRISPLPIGSIIPLLRHDNFMLFNLVFSFLSFSILQVNSFDQGTHTTIL